MSPEVLTLIQFRRTKKLPLSPGGTGQNFFSKSQPNVQHFTEFSDMSRNLDLSEGILGGFGPLARNIDFGRLRFCYLTQKTRDNFGPIVFAEQDRGVKHSESPPLARRRRGALGGTSGTTPFSDYINLGCRGGKTGTATPRKISTTRSTSSKDKLA